jgi:lysophospholipid acyltransferase (LPLAT)-like uncharacterized protein
MDRFKWPLVGLAGKWLIDLLFATTTNEIVADADVCRLLATRRFIAAFWHSRILMISHHFRGWGGAILVSGSTDGEIIARVLQRQGHLAIRGSSTRGGLRAIAAMIKSLKARHRPGVIIPDGPQGPRFKVQPGILTLAQKTGYPIVPMTYSARHLNVFSSWDRFILPWPFTRCRMICGRPLTVSAGVDKAGLEGFRQGLEDELNRITQTADRFFGHRIR